MVIIVGLFKKKEKYNSKYKINEFVSFHQEGDLKHGVIYKIYLIDGSNFYDIKVGGEATWLSKMVPENKIIKIEGDGVIHKK